MQALRVLVNNELCDMEQALTAALPHVRIGGRVAVLCFQPDEASVRQKVFARVRPAPATPQHRTRGEDKGTGAARAAGGKRGEQEHPAPEPSQQHTHGKGQAAGVGLHATNERRWRVRREIFATVLQRLADAARGHHSGQHHDQQQQQQQVTAAGFVADVTQRLNSAFDADLAMHISLTQRAQRTHAAVLALPRQRSATGVEEEGLSSCRRDVAGWASSRCSDMEAVVARAVLSEAASGASDAQHVLATAANNLRALTPPVHALPPSLCFRALWRRERRATQAEIRRHNPRSRSATLHVYERVA